MYLVKKGAIKVCFSDEEKEIILAFGIEGELVCNFISFLAGTTSQLYLQAIKKLELIEFTKSKFEQLIASDDGFADKYRKALENKFVEILHRHVIQYNADPQTRVELLLKQK